MRCSSHVEGHSLRIAMVAACPFPALRGSQVLIRDLAQALADGGHRVHVVTYPKGENLVPIRGIRLHRIRTWRRLANGRGWRKMLLDVQLAGALYRVVRRERIDVIHAHNYEGPLVSYAVRWLTGVPVVYHSHNALSDELAYHVKPRWRMIARQVGRVLDRHVPRRADFSVALTPELEGFLKQQGVADTRVATIPPVPPLRRRPDGAGGTQGPFPGCFVVMYTGNLDAYQDLDVLSDAVDRLTQEAADVRLVIVTHEADWEPRAGGALARLIRDGQARVIVAATFSRASSVMASADVLVCPRSSWSGFPIKLFNYMMTGRPIVAAAGSAKGLLDEATALVVRNRDVDDMVRALRRLYDDPGLRQRLADNAWAAVRQLAASQPAVKQLEHVYRQLLARRPRPPVAEGLIAFRRERIRSSPGARLGGGEIR